jgi:filamentous hemagglutinin family protein
VGFEGGNLAPTSATGTDGRVNVTVKQLKQQAFLEWHTFNIGRNTTVLFDQSAGGSDVGKWIAFNEILDPAGHPSQILGQIKAAGQVYVINQNGIIFGGTSQVNTHALVASSLPINTNLVSRGLLNNPDNQFLFSALKIDAGTKGTPAFDPPKPLAGTIGDVVVQAGASLTAPTTASKVGGRVMLIGPNVINEGTISTPDGQTILAAGLQVGFIAHDTNDPSIRGLDIFVGKISDPTITTSSAITGTVANRGVIDIPRGNLTMTGKRVEQLGAVVGSTSVSLNSSVRLDASYDAVANSAKGDGATEKTWASFLNKSSGTVVLGSNSTIQLTPESSVEKIVGTQLALPTRVDIRGKVVRIGVNSTILAPNANVTISAGVWNFLVAGTATATGQSPFVRTAGQVYFESGAKIDVAGTMDAVAPITQNILTLQLRGSEFADSSFNRTGPLRGIDITLDIRRQGVYNGFAWVGTPLADASGFVGIIERTANELTAAGGKVIIGAGSSVVMQPGSAIDVSGGWVRYAGGMVETTRVMYRNHIFDISNATPDRVYDGIYTGTNTFNHIRWGITNTYSNPFMSGAHYEPGYYYGAAGGTIDISAPAMALDGNLLGSVVNGSRQRDLPAQPSTLNLNFTGEKRVNGNIVPFNPNPPAIFLQSGVNQRPAAPFRVDAAGDPQELSDDRKRRVYLSPDALKEAGFGFIKIINPDGNITLASGEVMETPPMGSVELAGANVDVRGSILSPGGSVTLRAYNISPTDAEILRLKLVANSPDLDVVTPAPRVGRGLVSIASGSSINVAGLLIDDRLSAPAPLSLPLVLTGGMINLHGYSLNLSKGSVLDVSGGARIDWFGKRSYGNAGILSLKAGQDINLSAVLGGQLSIGSTLRGFAGPDAKGGTLEIQAPFIQIGGSTGNRSTLLLQPNFFSQGGFASFNITGIGNRTDESRTPGVYIAPGTTIEPIPSSQIIVPFGGGRDGLLLKEVAYPEGLRSPVSLTFNAPTLRDEYGRVSTPPGGVPTLVRNEILVRGDVIMGEGSRIQAGPLGNVGFKAGTVSIFGSVFAPGGTITLAGADVFPAIVEAATPLPTVYVGPRATLSTAGKVVLVPDAYGRRIGNVLPGGAISVGGNIVLERGSLLDVSGASGSLDIPPAYLGMNTVLDPVTGLLKVLPSSGLTTPQFAYSTVATQVDSNAGLISLAGGQLLLSRATLLGAAGGPTATGGTLLVKSGRFYPEGELRPPSDTSLTVIQDSSYLPGMFFRDGLSGVGRPVTGFNSSYFTDGAAGAPGGVSAFEWGYFAVNDFVRGRFASLQLGGNVFFKGPINITAPGALSVGDGGFVSANSTVNLTASYIALGQAFRPPFQIKDSTIPFLTPDGSTFNFAPTSGLGRLIVTANLIDIGNLTLTGIGNTRLVADGGNIRGNGTFSMAGDLYMRAAQIYPTTGSVFTIAAYDHAPGDKGSITITGSGTVPLPMSAGGTLNLFSSEINQGGVLRAPFGVINLGWDGTGIAPVNLVVGNKLALPVTENLRLLPGSITSVSAIDPVTGQGILIPFGRFNPEDGTWIGPNGQNVTVAGLPQKGINIAGTNIDAQAGSVIDIRGGGDLYAYSWAPGLLGNRDLLGTASDGWSANTQYQIGDLVTYRGQTWSARQSNLGRTPATGFFWTPLPESYAIIPGYSEEFSPFAAFNRQAAALLGDPGYVSNGLRMGEKILIGTRSAGLPTGSYTLLPARYGLLPGAFTVTPVSGMPIGTARLPDGARYVNAYRYLGLNPDREIQPIYSRWEVLPSGTLRYRAGYDEYFANSFMTEYARENNIPLQRLPQDSGQLVLAAVSTMNLAGKVLSRPIGSGRGGLVDIASGSNITINSTGTGSGLVLKASQLNSFGAESLLIGGTRTLGAGVANVNARTNRITVSNEGTPLTGSEIILVSNQDIRVSADAVIQQTGTMSGGGDTLLVKGDGALLRVSADPLAETIRSGVTQGSDLALFGLRVDSGALISGAGLTLDSTSNRDFISDSATITGKTVSINSGRMRLQLDGSAPLPAGSGLILGGRVLSQLEDANSVSLQSYSTMDIFGSGTFGSSALKNLEIHAGAIRREGTTGTATFEAENILIDNKVGVIVDPAGLVTALPSGTLQFNAGKITLGANRVEIAKFENLDLNASKGLFLDGNGGLNVSNNVTGKVAFIAAVGGASTQSITAGGDLTLDGVAGSVAPSRDTVGSGSSITLTGSDVAVGTDIIMPSGVVKVVATGGAVDVTGSIDAGGTAKTLYDVTRYTSGGVIQLSAGDGDVTLGGNTVINVAAPAAGGNAGSLIVSAPKGVFDYQNATLLATAGVGGSGGSFSLDVFKQGQLAAITSDLNSAGFNNSLAFRVRSENVGLSAGSTVLARDFRLSADGGSITIDGTINVSGSTGGNIRISARDRFTLGSSSELNAFASGFNNAGKGGAIFLESRDSVLDLKVNSIINLAVGDTTPAPDQFSGTLHLRARQEGAITHLADSTVASTISGASSIIAEGFKIFDLSGSGGVIDAAVQSAVQSHGTAIGGQAAAIEAGLLATNAGLANVFTVRMGAELENKTGDLIMGSANHNVAVTNWDLSTFRFGVDRAPGVLTLRARGDVKLYGAISDGFQSAAYNAGLLTQPVLPGVTAMPENAQSWSYRIVAGADTAAADSLQVLKTDELAPDKGSLHLGRFFRNQTPSGQNASTRDAVAGHFQVIRTGSGDIDIATGRDVLLLNPFATIYTAGTRVKDATMGGTFDVPNPNLVATNATGLGAAQQNPAYTPQYSLAGGNISISSQGNIGHFKQSIVTGNLEADSSLQMPTNWLYRRGYVDPETGLSGLTSVGTDTASTTWWVDFSNFFQGIGALGGGNINLNAGGNISNVDAVIPTNARMPKGSPSIDNMVELGGGDLNIKAGGNLDAGVYYVERGRAVMNVDGSVVTNSTRSIIVGLNTEESQLPTTLFMGKGSFKIDARGDIKLGPISNPFMLPGGLNNSVYYKTYFSTYSPESGVDVTSLGGDITFRQSVVTSGGVAPMGILQAYYENVLRYGAGASPSASRPWLRLNETNISPFAKAAIIGPSSLSLAALGGDVNLVGSMNLFPSASGNLSVLANGAVNGVQSLGTTKLVINNVLTDQTIWTVAQLNLSDADPSIIPGILNPSAYRSFSADEDETSTTANFLGALTSPFDETGSLNSSVSTQQALHAAGLLHRGDLNPVRIYAGNGDISGLTLYSPKATRVVASQDITDIALYLQNTSDSDVSIVSAGRDVLPYNPSSTLRSLTVQVNNRIAAPPLAGDIQISGPGALEVLAGNDIRLGNGPTNADGTGGGIVSAGNARNPALPFDGADLIVAAGIGPSFGLSGSKLDYDAFIDKYVTGADGARYLAALNASSDSGVTSVAQFNALSDEEQDKLALQLFFIVLRETGRDRNLPGSPGFGGYAAGLDAISTLFPGSFAGDIQTNSRDIRTKSGGDISLLIPGGNLTLQTQQTGRAVPPGIVTESGGNINIFTNSGVDIGISRIFTLRGGSQVIWASTGDIAAGSSSKTVQSAPPTRVLIDPTSMDVATDLAGLATGGGIGVLATVAGIPPGSVDLIAVTGNVDAGDAGIRATGNLNIAAVQVLNASNIAVGGSSSGTPAAPAVSVPNVSVATQGSNAAAASTQATQQTQNTNKQSAPPPMADEPPSVLSLEVIGYGGSEGSGEDDEDEEERRRREKQEAVGQEPTAGAAPTTSPILPQ